jgi:hypothetical protein
MRRQVTGYRPLVPDLGGVQAGATDKDSASGAEADHADALAAYRALSPQRRS